MKIYAESSAVLAWAMGERRADEARRVLAAADAVVASELTLLEADRAIICGAAMNRFTRAESERMRAEVSRAASDWTIAPIDRDVVAAARAPFPREPVRALDAIHLATLVALR